MILQNCWLKETKVVKYKSRLLWQLLSLMWVEMKLRYGDGEVPKFANAPKSYDILARILNMMWFERQLFLHQRISIFAQIFQIKKIKKILKFMCSMRVFVCLFFNFFYGLYSSTWAPCQKQYLILMFLLRHTFPSTS